MKRIAEQELIKWQVSKNRLPLVLNGARQVGKTYLLKEFGAKNFKNIIYANFETNKDLAEYFNENISPKRILQFLEASYQQNIIPQKTLVIFDEIQSCPRALTSLKYFAEEAPEIHMAAAGSLLGVAINRENFSFPVGKIQSLTIYPFDFREFLMALGLEQMLDIISEHFISNHTIPADLHSKAMDLYKQYLIVGGMPMAVKKFIETEKLNEIAEIQNEILNAYISDMAKYANNSESVKIREAYNSLPNQLAKDNKKFQYKIIQKGASTALFGRAIDWLCFTGVAIKCQKIEQATEPIAVYTDLSSFKLYMADVGMLVMRSGIAQQTILSALENQNIFLGAIAENYVAQALTAKGNPLYYWESKSIAEVDFVLQKSDKIIPIEVKAGTNTRSRSLAEFIKKYKPEYSIRISAKNFGFENNIKSVPLYAVWCI